MNTQAYVPQYKFPVRPQPFRDEGPNGFLLRLAEANWMSFAELKALDMWYAYPTLKAEGLLPVEAVDPDLHQRTQYFTMLLHKKKRVWNHRYARFCPLCLAEDAYWRVEWELLFHDACATHQAWLVDQCTSCGKKLTWQRNMLLRCSCGADLRAETVRFCPENVARLAAIIKHKVIVSEPSVDMIAPFSHTDIEQTQRIVRYLGNYMKLSSGKNPLKMQRAGDMTNSWTVTSLAAEICANWPHALHDSLANIQKESSGEQRPSLNTVFGHAYHYLYKGLKEKAFDEVRAAFELWLSSSWKGGLAKRNKRLTLMLLAHASWIPANLACDLLGISHQRLKLLVHEGMIEGEMHISEKNRKFLMVRRDNLEVVVNNLSGEVDMTTAGRLLGLCKKRTRTLLKLIFPEARKAGLSPSSPWVVSRFEINHLLSIAEELNSVSVPDEGCVSLHHILRYWAWDVQLLGALIHAVKTREVLPTNLLDGVVGLSAWSFNEHFLNAWKHRHQSGLGLWLTIPQAAKLMGIKEQVAYQLVEKGMLKAEIMPKQTKRGTRIKRSEIDRFKVQYVFATAIAHQLGVSPRKAISMLHKRLIEPSSEPERDGMRQVIYLRTDALENVMISIMSNENAEFQLE